MVRKKSLALEHFSSLEFSFFFCQNLLLAPVPSTKYAPCFQSQLINPLTILSSRIIDTTVTYETDLLARIHSIVVPGLRVRGLCNSNSNTNTSIKEPTSAQAFTLVTSVVDERVFMESFLELPGGLVLRRDWASSVGDGV
jgi:hypothetical protein